MICVSIRIHTSQNDFERVRSVGPMWLRNARTTHTRVKSPTNHLPFDYRLFFSTIFSALNWRKLAPALLSLTFDELDAWQQKSYVQIRPGDRVPIVPLPCVGVSRYSATCFLRLNQSFIREWKTSHVHMCMVILTNILIVYFVSGKEGTTKSRVQKKKNIPNRRHRIFPCELVIFGRTSDWMGRCNVSAGIRPSSSLGLIYVSFSAPNWSSHAIQICRKLSG